MKVILVPKPIDIDLWQKNTIAAFGSKHEVRIYDPTQSIEAQFFDVDVVVDMGGAELRSLVDAAKQAKLWQLMSVGYDHIDLVYLRQSGIAVSHCPGLTSSVSLAEGAMMFMLMIVKQFNQTQFMLTNGQLHHPVGEELEGRVLGLIGFGASGQALAHRAKGFGMRFMIVKPRAMDRTLIDTYDPVFVGKAHEMDRIFAEADFVSMHLPLTPETRGVVDARMIGLMKPSAVFINVARGDLADQEALYDALLHGRIAGIGTDVHAGVKPNLAHPVYQHPNFYALPHVLGVTTDIIKRRAAICVENVDRLGQGLEPRYRIDRTV